jgi:multidrug efflux pump subunit AcrA (membrane-fusion protein)
VHGDKRWRAAAALLLAGMLTIPFLLDGHYRVTADATLEGAVQRVVAAPVAGYVLEASARPGDLVAAGDLLARLDDRDLELESVRLSSERNRLEREYRSAIAAHDSPQVAIVKAQIDRATAELELTEQRLKRVRIVSPMNGVVVNGDFSQQLGAPLEKGQVMFEIASLAEYRVMLEVDEREIAPLKAGQSGQLALVGLPGRTLPFAVERITPISTQADGRNFFLVEARLQETPEALRPGMEGVAKISIGDRRLAWIWAHELTDWLALQAWLWLG